ncbi:MAG: cation-translocating P-type ATPase, partial [Clostridia bacterium]|nr:cation-translocating P-type ATPase [Clostridia bacterium]
QEARLLKDGVETEADVSTLSVGDVLFVREGDRIPLDGTLRSGIGFVDESMLSGEAVPVRKETGDPVYAGTINTEGSFSFEATADREHTLMSDIIVDVEASFAQKSRLQNRTDRVVRWFCPAVILLGVLAALAWFLFLSPGDLPKAARVLISVIIVACPCALGVAVPLSVSSAVSVAAGKGVVIKESQVVEQLGEVSWVGFDKTGTLTNGRFDVTDIILLRAPSVEAMLLDAALAEKQSYHPLAEAVLRESGLRPEEIPTADKLRSVPGKGVIAMCDGSTIVVGSPDFVAEQGAPGDDLETIAKQLGDQQKSMIVICKDGVVEGACFLTDELRPEAAEAVRDLEAMDVSVALLTGDSEGATQLAAEQAGISDVRARQLPEDKSARLRAEQERGAVTAMVGDGLNDVPSLARADVGFELGGKTALAGDTANVVILDGDLRKVPWSLQLGRKAVRNIRQNLVLSCVYNVVALSVAAAGLLNPIVAAAAMSLSSISVVLNATRVRRGSH